MTICVLLIEVSEATTKFYSRVSRPEQPQRRDIVSKPKKLLYILTKLNNITIDLVMKGYILFILAKFTNLLECRARSLKRESGKHRT